MTDDHRRNKYTVSLVSDREQLEACIGRCVLDETDVEILRRKCIRKQSNVEISLALHMSRETVGRRYKRAVAVLAAVAKKFQNF